MIVRLAPGLRAALAAHASRAAPEEACGLLFGRAEGGTVAVESARAAANVHEGDRRRAFTIDPQAQFDAMRDERAGGPALVGVYHSHPEGSAEPSARDLEGAAGSGLVWLILARQGEAWTAKAYDADAAGLSAATLEG